MEGDRENDDDYFRVKNDSDTVGKVLKHPESSIEFTDYSQKRKKTAPKSL